MNNVGTNAYSLQQLYKQLETKFYFVRVPASSLYTEEEIRALGLPSSVSIDGDINSLHSTISFRHVRLPLTDILFIYENGYPIFIPNKDDVLKVASDIDYVLSNIKAGHSIDTSGKVDLLNNFIKDILKINNKNINTSLTKDIVEIENDFLGSDFFGDTQVGGVKSASGITYDLDSINGK